MAISNKGAKASRSRAAKGGRRWQGVGKWAALGLAALLFGLCAAPRAAAQNLCATTDAGKVACAVANVYGPAGLSTTGETLVSHNFVSGQTSPNSFILNVTALSSAVGGQLGVLPLVSPASGISFSFDKSLGVFVPSEYNFGPVLSERAGTIGRHKILFGFAYQAFDFDKLDGVDLKNLHAAFGQTPVGTCSTAGGVAGATNEGGCAFIRDTLVTTNNIDLRVNQYTAFISFGLTSKLDVSVAIPTVNVRMAVTSNAVIHNNGLDDDFQFVASSSGTGCANPCFNRTFSNATGATGIGDVTVRVKYELWNGEKAGLAVGGDIRLPTGDSLNYLGSGAVGIKPFGAFSASIKRFSGHVNLGYEWNGQSFLAGNLSPSPDPATGITPAPSKDNLPSQFFYTVGGEVGIFKRLSGAVDFLGARYFNAPGIQSSTFTELPACDPTKVNSVPTQQCNAGQFLASGAVDQDIQQFKSDYNTADLAVGLRFRPLNKFLITANTIIKLNDSGLRSKFVPLLGISYSH